MARFIIIAVHLHWRNSKCYLLTNLRCMIGLNIMISHFYMIIIFFVNCAVTWNQRISKNMIDWFCFHHSEGLIWRKERIYLFYGSTKPIINFTWGRKQPVVYRYVPINTFLCCKITLYTELVKLEVEFVSIGNMLHHFPP